MISEQLDSHPSVVTLNTPANSEIYESSVTTFINMNSSLSYSSSSSSEDERPSFGGPTVNDQPRFKMGRPQVENLTFSDHSSESPTKRHLDEDSDSSGDLPIKKSRVEEYVATEADDKAALIMAKMGYKIGVGLGKHGQGRLEPVEAASHKGRRGLGHYNEKLMEANLQYDPNNEVVSVQEPIEWLKNSQEPVPSTVLHHWMRLGPAKTSIEDENNFCDLNLVKRVVNSKSVFDTLDKNEMRKARTRSNPFETIRSAFFLNRAAVKMANIDKACDFMFTKPASLQKGELLYFADVCAGPGGFSEYVLWRRKWYAKGFGFTLKATNDFKLDDFYAGSPETFHPFYGPKGDGDVYSPENQKAFTALVMRQTKNEGVHFMMADGGFSVEGEEDIQEILSKQLYLCQCLVGLKIVRKGGNFVTKVFDLFTPFSAGLVYLMHRCFESVSIFKPNTSRPANSERYLICKGKLENVEDTISHLESANHVLLEKNATRDVMELVPLPVLKADVQFYEFLKNSNNILGEKQIVGLLKIAAYCEDPTLFEERQPQMRKECLNYWEVPDQTRTAPRHMKPDERLRAIIKNSSLRFLSSKSTALTTSNLENTIMNTPYDWCCMPCGSSSTSDNDKAATFYIGLGRTKTFRYTKGTWIRVQNLELLPDTLVYAEMIAELRGDYRHQRKTFALHILDAYVLGGEDVSRKSLQERHELTKVFCEAMWKPTYTDFIRVRAKEMHSLTNNLDEKLRLKPVTMKNGASAEAYVPIIDSSRYDNDGDEPFYYIPNSLLFLKGTAQYWSRHVSRSSGYSYYFNCKDKTTLYDRDRPPNANASFPESIGNRVVWQWRGDPALPIDAILRLIRNKCSPR